MCAGKDRISKGGSSYDGRQKSFIQSVCYIPAGTHDWTGSHIKPYEQVVEVTVRNHKDVAGSFNELNRLLFKNKMKAYVDHDDGLTTFRVAHSSADAQVTKNFMITLLKFVEADKGDDYKAFLRNAGLPEKEIDDFKKENITHYDI